MLSLKQKIQFSLNVPSIQLIQIELAYQDTFVLLVLDQQLDHEVILHVTHTGHLINKYTLTSNSNSISMISPQQVAMTMIQQNCVFVINLVESKSSKIAHSFKKQAIDEIELFVYPLTSLFCISEYSVHTRNQLRLTYYNQKQKSIEIEFEYHDDELKNLMVIDKCDNHSQVGWYIRNYAQNYEEIVIHDIVTNNELKRESRLRRIIIRNYSFIDYSKASLLNLIKIWRFRKDQYLILLSREYCVVQELQTNEFLVLNESKKTIRIPQFNLPTNSIQSYIAVHFSEEFFIVATRKWTSFKQDVQMTSYLFENKTEKLIKIGQSIKTIKADYFHPNYQYHTIIQAKYQNPLHKIELQLGKVVSLSQTYLHFLLAINEDFDDDLLQDSLQLLNQEEYS